MSGEHTYDTPPYEDTSEVDTQPEKIGYGEGYTVASERHPQRNDDSFLNDWGAQTYWVWDGVGQSGEMAAVGSMRANRATYDYFKDHSEPVLSEGEAAASMYAASINAHESILEHGGGMTTAAGLRFFWTPDGRPMAAICHTADSRVYRMRGGLLEALTADNNQDREWQAVLDSVESQEDLDDQPDPLTANVLFKYRNIVSAPLGNDSETPQITVTTEPVQKDDVYLIETDGIHDNLTAAEIEAILRLASNTRDVKPIAQQLVMVAQQRSHDRGHLRAKPDDMTALIVKADF